MDPMNRYDEQIWHYERDRRLAERVALVRAQIAELRASRITAMTAATASFAAYTRSVPRLGLGERPRPQYQRLPRRADGDATPLSAA